MSNDEKRRVSNDEKLGKRSYWDGGYSGNPPLGPLLKPVPPRQSILIRAQPHVRSGVPSTPTEITNRLNEIACRNVLEAELAALPPGVALTSYDADEAVSHLPISTRFNGEEAFPATLFESGRNAEAIASHPAAPGIQA